MSDLAHRIQRKIMRLQRLRDVDTIAEMRARNPEFPAMLERVRQAGTDNLKHFGGGYTHEGGYFLQQNTEEFASLCLFLKEHGPHKHYMEIGSASGGACLFLYREVGFETVLSLDNGEHPRAPEQPTHFSQIPNFQQYLGDSHVEAARRFLLSTVTDKLDIAFIDGDHSAEGVWQDIELTLPFCRPGTLILLHDTIACAGVRDAWLKIARDKVVRPLAEYIGKENSMGIGVGVVL